MKDHTVNPTSVEMEEKNDTPVPERFFAKFMRLPWHVLVFIVYPIVFLASSNSVGFLKYGLTPLLRTGAGALCVFVLLSLILRSACKAGIAISILTMTYFAYGLTRIPEDEFGENELYFISKFCSPYYVDNFFTWPVLLFVVLAIAVLWKWNKNSIGSVTKFFNICALLLFCFGTFALVQSEIAIIRNRQSLTSPPDFSAGITLSPQDPRDSIERLPDIYLIIPDAFTGPMITACGPNDIDEFIKKLKTKGFQVPGKPFGNYTWTYCAVPSMLNMNYIHELFPELFQIGPKLIEETDKSQLLARKTSMQQSIDRRAASQSLLTSKGYVILPEDQWWENKSSKTYLKEDVDIAYEKHPFKLPREVQNSKRGNHFMLTLGQIQRTKRLADESGPTPRFIFCYINTPHSPSVFKENGDYSPEIEYVPRSVEFSNAYYAQRKYIGKRLEEVVEYILANSNHDPIIVIASDHGQRPNVANLYDEKTALAELNFNSRSVAAYHNFIAIYMPEKYRRDVPEDLSNVNIFRYVFNCLFDANLPLLPNRHFEGTESAQVLTETTEMIEKYKKDFDSVVKELQSTKADATVSPERR